MNNVYRVSSCFTIIIIIRTKAQGVIISNFISILEYSYKVFHVEQCNVN